jgi:hypothetical protein
MEKEPDQAARQGDVAEKPTPGAPRNWNPDRRQLRHAAGRWLEMMAYEQQARAWALTPWYKRLLAKLFGYVFGCFFICFYVFGWVTLPLLFGILWYCSNLLVALCVVVPLTISALAVLLYSVERFRQWILKHRGGPMNRPKAKPYTGRETKLITLTVIISFMGMAYFLFDTRDLRLLAYSLMLLAVVAGYAVGLLLTPYTKQEQGDFEKILKGLSLFVSGFLLSKLEPLLTKLLASSAFKPTDVFLPVSFAGCFLASCTAVFVHRKYVFEVDDSGTGPQSVNATDAGASVPTVDQQQFRVNKI